MHTILLSTRAALKVVRADDLLLFETRAVGLKLPRTKVNGLPFSHRDDDVRHRRPRREMFEVELRGHSRVVRVRVVVADNAQVSARVEPLGARVVERLD